jgi:hypothetical protein
MPELVLLTPSERKEENACNSKVLEFVDRGLDHFGPTTKQVVYWNLWIRYNLKKNEIPIRPEKFVELIREIFGDGSHSIEQVIIQEMAMSQELKGVNSSDLTTALKQARAYFQRQMD